ncbi:hypothetical protein JOM56_013056 [Amanita muscaria]
MMCRRGVAGMGLENVKEAYAVIKRMDVLDVCCWTKYRYSEAHLMVQTRDLLPISGAITWTRSKESSMIRVPSPAYYHKNMEKEYIRAPLTLDLVEHNKGIEQLVAEYRNESKDDCQRGRLSNVVVHDRDAMNKRRGDKRAKEKFLETHMTVKPIVHEIRIQNQVIEASSSETIPHWGH